MSARPPVRRLLRGALLTVVLSALMSFPTAGLLEAVHHAAGDHATAGHPAAAGQPAGHDPAADHAAGAGHQHNAGSASMTAPVDASGKVDHTAMAILSGQMDGPSTPTNSDREPAHVDTAGASITHTVRVGAGAMPAVLLALLLAAALVEADRRRRRAAWRLTPATSAADRTGGRTGTTRPGLFATARRGLAGTTRRDLTGALGRGLAGAVGLALAAPGHGVLLSPPTSGAERHALLIALICLPVTVAAALAVTGATRAATAVAAEWRRSEGTRHPARAAFGGALALVVSILPVVVVAQPAQAGSTAGVCPAAARTITYDIAAFSLVIPLNGWGDKLPDGQVYALKGADARVGKAQLTANPRLSEPLVVRANVGDCIRIVLRNDLDHRVGVHPEGLVQFDPETSDGARVGRNPDSTVTPGGSTTYTWYADKQGEAPISDIANIDTAEEKHTSVQNGLYGAVVVHPQGSVWTNPVTGANLLDPATGRVVESRVFADVTTPTAALRSYAMILMDEAEDVLDRDGRQPTFPTSGLPDSTFGINYRAEPLRNRLRAILEHRGTKTPANPAGTAKTITLPNGRVITPTDHFCDGYVPELNKVVADPGAKCMGEESHLQSWVFGDESKLTRVGTDGTVTVDSDNVIPKAYVGDPVQFHVVNPGTKETHPWHQHTQRWFKDPNNPDSPRNDVQSIGPGEGYRLELEGGAGGLQRTVGDSIFHCHLYPHFAQGMWGHLRIFDRLRNGTQKYADGTPIQALRELSSRAGQTAAPTATQPGYPLFVKGDVGQRSYRAPNAVVKDDFAAIRRPGDAPRGPTALEAAGMPALNPAKPGNGYIDPCPTSAPTRTYRPHVIDVPITYNSAGWKDRQGRMYAEESAAAAVRAGTKAPEPFTIRARLGECVQVFTTNDLHLDEDPKVPLDHVNRLDGDFMHAEETSEVSTHVHLVKFDELSSDGTSVGWNYSSSAMPGQTYGYRWFVDQPLRTVFFHDHQYANLHQQKGLFAAMNVEPADATWHDPRTGTPTDGTGPVADIRSASGPDFREISVFHQDRIPMWKNNGTGSPVNPPPDVDDYGADQGGYALNYRNEPFQIRTKTGVAGPKGDPAYVYSSAVHGDPSTPVFQAYPKDPVIVRNVDGAHEEVHTFNIHGHRWLNEPDNPDSTLVDTQSLALAEYYNYEVSGATVKRKPRNTKGTVKQAKNDAANGTPNILSGGAGPAGDYLYGSTPLDDQWLGMWGIFRVPGGKLADLQQLPDQKNPGGGTQWPALKPGDPVSAPPRLVKTCPAQSADRSYDIAAIGKDIVYNATTGDHDPAGALYVLAEHEAAVRAGTRPTEPLYLRANAGDCLKITLTNKLPAGGLPAHTGDVPLPADAPFPAGNRVSLHPALVEFDVTGADGATVGYNYDQTVAPGASITAYWYVPEELAGSTATLVDFGDRRGHRHHGLFGGLLVEPKGSTWTDPASGAPLVTGPAAVIRWTDAANNPQVFREFALQWQDGLNLRTAQGAPIAPAGPVEDPYELGNRGVNYRTERFAPRLLRDPDQADVLSSVVHGDPATPVLRAYTGDPVKVRLMASSDRGRAHSFVLSGHGWHYQAADPESTVVSTRGLLLASQASSLDLVGGAGGPRGTTGDFLYRDGNQANQTNAGLWGLLRVHATAQPDLKPIR